MEIRILVIEDNILTLDEIEVRLNNIGYKNIETAINGEEAIKKAANFQPDLLLSDINLGKGIDGIEAVTKINEEQDVPVIYLTAYDDEITLKRAKITEPYAYLTKPFQEKELNIAISIALYKHKVEKQLKQANKKLQEANATKDKFFSIIAHDLKSPFTALLDFSKLLLKNHTKYDEKKREHHISIIYNTTNKTHNLLDNLLTWSRSQLDKIKYNFVTINVKFFVGNIISLIQSSANKKEIKIVNNVERCFYVKADENTFNTVLRNLITNAIKFTPRKGTITMNAKQIKTNNIQYIEICVADTGVGISKERVKNLFKIEKNISTNGTEEEHGTGLGLVLCKEFVEKNNGKIWVESEEGKGSCFKFILPES